jgi:hypothetical protein
MNWCGCSNFHATGYYNRAGAYLCAEEKSTIRTALQIIETLGCEMPNVFSAHAAGFTSLNISGIHEIRNAAAFSEENSDNHIGY